ncbi:hypothetical protein DFH09DRAFT_1073257 [Mycena vulgaris]|nr:hypothetical protein DFH09DRAFT_1073257 [Mycena vulgaris]
MRVARTDDNPEKGLISERAKCQDALDFPTLSETDDNPEKGLISERAKCQDALDFPTLSETGKTVLFRKPTVLPAIVAGVPDGKTAGDYVSIYAPVVGRGDMYKVFRLATLKTGASSQRGFQAPLRQLPAAGPDPGGFPGFFNIHTFTKFFPILSGFPHQAPPPIIIGPV